MEIHKQCLYRNIIYYINIVLSILNTNYREHSHPLFTRCNLITVHDINNIEVGKCMYSHGSLQHSLPDVFIFTNNSHCYRNTIYVLSLALLKKSEQSIL